NPRTIKRLIPRANVRATLRTDRHTAASDNAMGAPLSAFFFAFIFYENRWFDINLCQILIEFR
ncbi:hypothetical protein CWB63_18400, partial [Pseudoalteromonas sp. S409]